MFEQTVGYATTMSYYATMSILVNASMSSMGSVYRQLDNRIVIVVDLSYLPRWQAIYT